MEYANAPAPGLGMLLTHPGGDGFFRPAGYLGLWWNARFAGRDPKLWHLSGLGIHLVNVMLVLALSRKLLSPARAWLAAALFAVHGSRPEAVVWVASRFDLQASMFVLVGILALERGRNLWAVAAMMLAALSKETGFVFPVLAALWGRKRCRMPTRQWVLLAAVSAALFAYRCYILGGIGGYPGGISPFLTAKALLVRLWIVLLFPLNFSRPLWLAGGVLLAVYAWCLISFSRRDGAGGAAWAVLFTLAAAAPAAQQLLIGADLQKSRLLYLPSLGICWLLAERIRTPSAAAVVLCFHVLALQHNLQVWRDVAARVEDYCRQPGGMAPKSIDGVYFLANGRAQCVAHTRR